MRCSADVFCKSGKLYSWKWVHLFIENQERHERKTRCQQPSQHPKRRAFNTPDEMRTPPKANMEIVNFGDMSIVRMTCEPGWKWSEHMRPIAGTRELSRNTFYLHRFRSLSHGDERWHSRRTRAGCIAITPPGHDAMVVGDKPCVLFDFQGASRNS